MQIVNSAQPSSVQPSQNLKPPGRFTQPGRVTHLDWGKSAL